MAVHASGRPKGGPRTSLPTAIPSLRSVRAAAGTAGRPSRRTPPQWPPPWADRALPRLARLASTRQSRKPVSLASTTTRHHQSAMSTTARALTRQLALAEGRWARRVSRTRSRAEAALTTMASRSYRRCATPPHLPPASACLLAISAHLPPSTAFARDLLPPPYFHRLRSHASSPRAAGRIVHYGL